MFSDDQKYQCPKPPIAIIGDDIWLDRNDWVVCCDFSSLQDRCSRRIKNSDSVRALCYHKDQVVLVTHVGQGVSAIGLYEDVPATDPSYTKRDRTQVRKWLIMIGGESVFFHRAKVFSIRDTICVVFLSEKNMEFIFLSEDSGSILQRYITSKTPNPCIPIDTFFGVIFNNLFYRDGYFYYVDGDFLFIRDLQMRKVERKNLDLKARLMFNGIARF